AQAGGNLGPAILEQLKNFFEVTVLSRHASIPNLSPSVRVRQVDYDSMDSLVSALRGQDAVVSALGTLALGRQLALVDAAVAAGVRRFIPSEFGSDTTNPKCATLPVFHDKLATQKVLRTKAATGTGLTYTVICTGPFLDWGLLRGFMNIKQKAVSLYDGGDRPFSTTTLPTIGRAVREVLMRPAETENRVVKVHSVVTTQSKLLEMAQKAVGPDGWTVKKLSIEAMLESSWADIKQGKHNLQTMLGFIVAASWGEGFGGHFSQTDNELLGIKPMSDEELQGVVNQLAAS
ncbi:uncharacterized protein THITE_45193, partial [Thermothielavioides terrestris NRRL 8126]